MTQVYITIGVISTVALLMCYIFIRQTMKEKKAEKDRLHRALKKRAKTLLQMIAIFPDDFLPKELQIFIYRCIIETYENLTKLEPNENQYIDGLKMHSAQMEATMRKPESRKNLNLQNAAQLNELRRYLNMMGEFLQRSVKRKMITTKQYSHYRLLIKSLIAGLAVDNYCIAARQAVEIGKVKLAIHYYTLAKQLLIKETPSGYQEQIKGIDEALAPLMESQVDEGVISEVAEPENQEESEWAEFEEESDWKKKNVYDE